MIRLSQKIDTENYTLVWLKRGIWLYFFLLIFEGALRKWVLPGLSDLLLIIRDPLAIVMLFFAWKANILKVNGYIIAMSAITILSVIATFFTGHQNIVVTVYGARIFLIQFPFIFVIGSVFSKEDVIKVGKLLLWISIPMTILIVLQFYSPQSAWVNRGVGGDLEGAGFYGALGYFRPPGTFSFTNGTSLFYHFLACFVFIFWLMPKTINKLLLVLATICVLIAIPISISRTLLFSVVISLIFYFFASYFRPNFLRKLLVFISSILVIGFIVSNLEFMGDATEAFTSRFTNASESEGGLEGTLIDRYLGLLIGAVTDTQGIPFFGHGMGMGTNAGSQLLTGGRTFLIAEDEWARTIGEMGILLGLAVIFTRLILTFNLSVQSFKAVKSLNFIPFLLSSFIILIVPQGQWSQPTSLGFAIFVTGILIASFKTQPE